MKFIRTFLIIILALGCLFQLAAFDFGLDLDNTSTFGGSGDWSLNQNDMATIWFSAPLGSRMSLYLSGLYEFSGIFSPDGNSYIPYRFDAGRVSFEGNLPGLFGPSTNLSFRVGRVPMQDFSGKVISGLNDGFEADLNIANSVVKVSAGYLGLVYKKDALVLLDSDDIDLYVNDSATASIFAPARMFYGLSYNFTEFMNGYDMGIETWGQLDLAAGSIKTHTFYVEPYVSGRIGRLFRWNAWGVYEFGYDAEWFQAVAGGARIRMTVPELMFLRVTASGLWAGGSFATSTPIRSFIPIRQSTIATVYSSLFTDSITAKLDVGITPLPRFTVNAVGAVFMVNGEVKPTAYASDSTSLYIGSEISGSIVYKVASDLNFNVNGGIFLPNTSNAFPAGTPMQWKAGLSASLSI